MRQSYTFLVQAVKPQPRGKPFDLRRTEWHECIPRRLTVERAIARHNSIFDCHVECLAGEKNCSCRLVLVVE